MSLETLGFLAARAVVRGDLDQAGGFGEVERGVADFGEEDGRDGVVHLEVGEDQLALALACVAVDVGFRHALGVLFEGVYVV
mgnify:CR=1 FL=1